MSLRTSRELIEAGAPRPVYAVPMLSKYFFVEDASIGLAAELSHIERKLGIQVGQSTPDGKFFLKREEECLAACIGAPMMMVDHVYYEHLTPEKVDEILDALE